MKVKIAMIVLVILIVLSVLVNIILIFILNNVIENSNEEGIKMRKAYASHYAQKNEIILESNIVFAGDSHIYNYNIGKFLPGVSAVNRGIAGESSNELFERIGSNVIALDPKMVIIEIGANDQKFGISIDETVSNVEQIIEKLSGNNEATEILVLSNLPITQFKYYNNKISYPMHLNSRSKRINEKLKKLCEEKQAKYVDIYNMLLDSKENMEKKFSSDGLHLNDSGYDVFTVELKKHLIIDER